MEISRPANPGYGIQTDTTSPTKAAEASKSGKPAASARSTTSEPRLEQLQQALGKMPEVDLEKVEQIKQALANGEIATDSAALAKAVFAYHRGSDL